SEISLHSSPTEACQHYPELWPRWNTCSTERPGKAVGLESRWARPGKCKRTASQTIGTQRRVEARSLVHCKVHTGGSGGRRPTAVRSSGDCGVGHSNMHGCGRGNGSRRNGSGELASRHERGGLSGAAPIYRCITGKIGAIDGQRECRVAMIGAGGVE